MDDKEYQDGYQGGVEDLKHVPFLQILLRISYVYSDWPWRWAAGYIDAINDHVARLEAKNG